MKDQLDSQMQALGAFIRDRRKNANLTLRQLAERTRLSNPYLSQIERGLHQPSVRVLRLLSDALNVSAETLLTQAGLLQAAAATVPGDRPAPTAPQNRSRARLMRPTGGFGRRRPRSARIRGISRPRRSAAHGTAANRADCGLSQYARRGIGPGRTASDGEIPEVRSTPIRHG